MDKEEEKRKSLKIVAAVLVIVGLLILLGVTIGTCVKDSNKDEDQEILRITLDINPSLEINVKGDKVESIKALNEDAKKVLDKELKGETLEEALKWVLDRSVDLDYIDRDQAVILVMADGKYDQEELERCIRNPITERDIPVEIVVVKETTKEDEDFAKENNITVAKAHYINELVKERGVNASDYVNKSIREIKETKDTGNTCEEGYKLEGSLCVKETGREAAKKGKVCPAGYMEYNGKCYEEAPIEETGNYKCSEGKLSGDKCVIERSSNAIPAKYSCSKGTAKTRYEAGLTNKNDGDANDVVCVDTSSATHPVSPCELNDGTEWTKSGGKCYWHRAGLLPEGCPGKVKVNGECWDDASNVLICKGARDGKRYSSRSEYCEGTVKYTKPTVSEYKCNGNAKLSGTKCITTESVAAEKERACKTGYKLVNNDRCINESNVKELEEGYVCGKDNSKLEGDTCILFETKEAIKS